MPKRCANNQLASKIQHDSLDKTTEVFINTLHDLDTCNRINTSRYTGFNPDSATVNYDQFTTPADEFNCMAEGCTNSGTLMITTSTDDPETSPTADVTFVGFYDATEFYAGTVTYYVTFPEPGTYTLSTTFADRAYVDAITNGTAAPSDVYTQTITVTEENAGEPIAIVIDLTDVPDSQVQGGWIATESGIVVNVAVTGTGTDLTFGVSTISFYDTLEEFQVNDTVVLGCVDDISADQTISALDAACRRAGYDPTSAAVEVTVTAHLMTPNAWKLNPLLYKGENTTGWYMQGDKRPVRSRTIDGVEYGFIEVPDIAEDECGFVRLAILDECNVTDAMLERVSVPVAVSLNPRQYVVLPGGVILVNASLIGRDLEVSYPRTAENAEHFIADDTYVTQHRARLAYTRYQDDKVKETVIYNNVLITSYPYSLTNSGENTYDFTFTVERDKNNRLYEIYRITG